MILDHSTNNDNNNNNNDRYLILIPEEKRPKAVEPARNGSAIRSLRIYLLLNYILKNIQNVNTSRGTLIE